MKTSTLTEFLLANGESRKEGEYAVVTTYTDTNEEYGVLRSAIGLIDFSAAGKFRIGGDEHVQFVNRLVTKDIEFLDVEKSIYTAMLFEDGRIMDLVTLYKQEDAIIMEASPERRDQVWNWLMEQKLEDVELEDLSDAWASIAFEGPYAWKLGQSLVNFEISSLPFQSFVEIEWKGHKSMLARVGGTGEYGYKLIIPAELAIESWNELLGFTEDDLKVQAVGQEALDVSFLEVRQPSIKVEGLNLNLYEACLEWLLTPHKEEFIGISALQGQKEKADGRKLVGFTFNKENELNQGDDLLIEDTKVGHVMQVHYSPSLEKNLGIGIVEQFFAVSGIEMEGLNTAGERVIVETKSSPYVLPKSWSIKIL